MQAQIERLHAHMEQQQGASAAAPSSAPAAATPSQAVLNGFDNRGGIPPQELVQPATLAGPSTSADTAATPAPDQNAAAVRRTCGCLLGTAMLVDRFTGYILWDLLHLTLLSFPCLDRFAGCATLCLIQCNLKRCLADRLIESADYACSI